MIDEGAVKALAEGKSLLPAGIRQIDGRFERGDAVLVKDREGREIARGLAAYNASDAERIAGKRTVEIEAILGYRGRDEMIHRDDLALTVKSMTVHTTDAALAAEMLAIGAAARNAARAMREAGDAAKTKALLRCGQRPSAPARPKFWPPTPRISKPPRPAAWPLRCWTGWR